MGVESPTKIAVDDTRTGNKVLQAIHAAVIDALTQTTVIEALVVALKEHDDYKKYLRGSIARRLNTLRRSM